MGQLLQNGHIVIHPLITAELALGSVRDRANTLALLDLLPQVRPAQMDEIRKLIESRHLYGLGIGAIDAHLLASALINPPTSLWTRDKPLRKVAEKLVIHASLI
jgi:hypothetical protein